MNDPTSRKKYVDALAAELDRWDVALIQGWIDTWSRQIAADVAADPHTWAAPDQIQNAIATARRIVADRAQFIRTFLDCESGAAGAADRDGDGAKWCGDCRDDDATIHPGAAEVCGNGLDDDCNGLVDDCH